MNVFACTMERVEKLSVKVILLKAPLLIFGHYLHMFVRTNALGAEFLSLMEC